MNTQEIKKMNYKDLKTFLDSNNINFAKYETKENLQKLALNLATDKETKENADKIEATNPENIETLETPQNIETSETENKTEDEDPILAEIKKTQILGDLAPEIITAEQLEQDAKDKAERDKLRKLRGAGGAKTYTLGALPAELTYFKYPGRFLMRITKKTLDKEGKIIAMKIRNIGDGKEKTISTAQIKAKNSKTFIPFTTDMATKELKEFFTDESKIAHFQDYIDCQNAQGRVKDSNFIENFKNNYKKELELLAKY